MLLYCPCLYCPSFLWESVVSVRGSDDVRLFLLFVYISIAVKDTIIREVDIPLTGSHRTIIVYFNPGPGFQTSNVGVVFAFYYLRWQMVVRFANICGMFYHHCIILIELMYSVFVPFDWPRVLSPVCFLFAHTSMNFCFFDPFTTRWSICITSINNMTASDGKLRYCPIESKSEISLLNNHNRENIQIKEL